MVTKTARTTKKTAPKKAAARRPKVARASSSQKVDYYPNRMTFAVSALAVVSLVLLCAMAMYGLR